MKKLSLAFIIGGALILSACNGNSNNNSTGTDSTTNTMSSTDTSTNKMMSDTTKSDTSKMMVDDHSKINDELKDLASKKNVSLPSTVTSDQQKDIDKLSKETGKDFDK